MKITFDIGRTKIAATLTALGASEDEVEKFLEKPSDSEIEVSKEDMDGLGDEFVSQFSVIVGIVVAYKFVHDDTSAE